MTRKVESVEGASDETEISHKLLGRGFKAVPVVDRLGYMAGIVAANNMVELNA